MRLLFLFCLLAAASRALGAFDVFLQVDGVNGSGSDPLYAGWSTVYSFESGLKNNAQPGMVGQTEFKLITLVKEVDAASLPFFARLAPGTRLARVKLVVAQRSPLRVEMWDVEARNVYFASQTFDATLTSPVTESVSFLAGELEWSYIEVAASGDPLREIYASWNVLSGTGSQGSRSPVYLGGVDSDGDGMPDGWEYFYRLNPLANDSTLDSDGDGMDHLHEFIAHTDPRSAQSVLRVNGIQTMSGGYLLMWQSVYGLTYRIESAPGLSGPWTTIKTVPASGVGFTTTTVNGTPPRTIFRVTTP